MSKLPTKTEVMAEMQEICDDVNGEESSHILMIKEDSITNTLWFKFRGAYVGAGKKFRPEVNLPKKGRSVICNDGFIYFSHGECDENGLLLVSSMLKKLIVNQHERALRYWRDYDNPCHRSNEWREEWNVDLKGVDDE